MSSRTDAMKVYMHDIRELSLVDKEEEVKLAKRIAAGDEEARRKLINSNLRLVIKIAHDFKGLGLPLLDLIAEGNIGLMRAVGKFDPQKGAKFSSYSAWWIKQAIRRALANHGRTIRIPIQSANKMNKIKLVRSRLADKLRRNPTDKEIAEQLDFSARTVHGLLKADLTSFSLNEAIQAGENGKFEELIASDSYDSPEAVLGRSDSFERLQDLVKSLEERESQVITMRFGIGGQEPKTLEEVSVMVGRTRERVRQIQNQALAKLKAAMFDDCLILN